MHTPIAATQLRFPQNGIRKRACTFALRKSVYCFAEGIQLCRIFILTHRRGFVKSLYKKYAKTRLRISQARFLLSYLLNCGERLVQRRCQIVDILDAYRQADSVGLDALFEKLVVA